MLNSATCMWCLPDTEPPQLGSDWQALGLGEGAYQDLGTARWGPACTGGAESSVQGTSAPERPQVWGDQPLGFLSSYDSHTHRGGAPWSPAHIHTGSP